MFREEILLLLVSGWKIIFLAQFSGQYQAGGCHACCSSCSRLLGWFRWAFHVALNNFSIPPRRLLKNRFFQVAHYAIIHRRFRPVNFKAGSITIESRRYLILRLYRKLNSFRDSGWNLVFWQPFNLTSCICFIERQEDALMPKIDFLFIHNRKFNLPKHSNH